MEELNAAYVEAVHGLTELWRTGIIPPSLRRIIYSLYDGTDEGRRVQTALEIVMSDLDKYRHEKYSFASEQAFATHLTDRIILIIQMARKDAQIDAEKAKADRAREEASRIAKEARAKIYVPAEWPQWLVNRYRDAVESGRVSLSKSGVHTHNTQGYRETNCWNCGVTIRTSVDFKCPICHTILCKSCGACLYHCLEPWRHHTKWQEDTNSCGRNF